MIRADYLWFHISMHDRKHLEINQVKVKQPMQEANKISYVMWGDIKLLQPHKQPFLNGWLIQPDVSRSWLLQQRASGGWLIPVEPSSIKWLYHSNVHSNTCKWAPIHMQHAPQWWSILVYDQAHHSPSIARQHPSVYRPTRTDPG